VDKTSGGLGVRANSGLVTPRAVAVQSMLPIPLAAVGVKLAVAVPLVVDDVTVTGLLLASVPLKVTGVPSGAAVVPSVVTTAVRVATVPTVTLVGLTEPVTVAAEVTILLSSAKISRLTLLQMFMSTSNVTSTPWL
jgi:hypothetical protein